MSMAATAIASSRIVFGTCAKLSSLMVFADRQWSLTALIYRLFKDGARIDEKTPQENRKTTFRWRISGKYQY